MFIGGIDEAGRGPAIGPMVLAAVKVNSEQIKKLQKLGVKESKLFGSGKSAKEKREKVYQEILKIIRPNNFGLAIISPEDIDSRPLTDLAIEKIAYLIKTLKLKKVLIDCLGGLRKESCLQKLREFLTLPEIIYEPKADRNYLPVAVASILAKVTRDREIEKLQQKVGIEFGTGYVNEKTDDFIRKYLQEHGSLPPGTRKKWRNVRRIIREHLEGRIWPACQGRRG